MGYIFLQTNTGMLFLSEYKILDNVEDKWLEILGKGGGLVLMKLGAPGTVY